MTDILAARLTHSIQMIMIFLQRAKFVSIYNKNFFYIFIQNIIFYLGSINSYFCHSFKKPLANWLYCGSSVVQQASHNSKIVGLNPTTATRVEKMMKKT
jgi:hypothetical protein